MYKEISKTSVTSSKPYGFETIYKCVPKNQNICIMWHNDPHYFAHFVRDDNDKKVCVQTYDKPYDPLFLSSDFFDKLITPSPLYFKNLNITQYNHKLIDFFYLLNPEHYEKISYDNFEHRNDQIILSGACGGGYTSRVKFLELKQKTQFKNLIHYLPLPGYTNNEHMTEMNYYNELSRFKGAFVGHHDFPIDFLLAKHIEVLMCGCVGFFLQKFFAILTTGSD